MSDGPEVAFYDQPEVVARYREDRANGLTVREERAVSTFFDPGGRLLDLGCGAGRTTHVLHERGFDVVGLDASRPMVGVATAADPEITYLAGDAAALPFADASFGNVLFSYNGIDELRPEATRTVALREIRRVLEPGGRFAFSTHNLLRRLLPYPPTRAGLGKQARFWLRQLRGGQLRSSYKLIRDGSPVHFTDPLSLVRLLRALEFDVLTFLGRSGPASRLLGPGLFVVVEKPANGE